MGGFSVIFSETMQSILPSPRSSYYSVLRLVQDFQCLTYSPSGSHYSGHLSRVRSQRLLSRTSSRHPQHHHMQRSHNDDHGNDQTPIDDVDVLASICQLDTTIMNQSSVSMSTTRPLTGIRQQAQAPKSQLQQRSGSESWIFAFLADHSSPFSSARIARGRSPTAGTKQRSLSPDEQSRSP